MDGLKEMRERWRVAQLKLTPGFTFKQAGEDVDALFAEIDRMAEELRGRDSQLRAARDSHSQLRAEVEQLFRKWAPLA